ncbi:metallophosphoesterase [Serpentinicella sp. ANB-PHB4]|uniref:metallophosphoesterase n=1 Tax=Serpentinicella sp. ANB-PHB4 TaxID=3074076 RepID=UPI0028633A7A|nr:metallophosphoesterase [Serpentinicella sp. ANB-PHB4]MDR5658629.1 metallophosphoesterase [Serpentinicella sp. ANB-PHB4]
MKIGVLGDSHGYLERIDRAMEHLEKVDLIFHTGDLFHDGCYIQKQYGMKVVGVRGNCDDEIDGEDELALTMGKYKIFICHGHQYNVKYNLQRLYYKGKEVNADIVIFGHTHMPCITKMDEMFILNPGSVALPRGLSKRSCAIIDLDEEITIKHIEI